MLREGTRSLQLATLAFPPKQNDWVTHAERQHINRTMGATEEVMALRLLERQQYWEGRRAEEGRAETG